MSPTHARCYLSSVWTEEYIAKRLSSVRTEDCARPDAIFRPYRQKNGRRKRYLLSVWTKDCVSRCYFPSGHFCSWCRLCHCKVLLCVSSCANNNWVTLQWSLQRKLFAIVHGTDSPAIQCLTPSCPVTPTSPTLTTVATGLLFHKESDSPSWMLLF